MTAQEFIDEGWHSAQVRPPSRDLTVEFARDERVNRQAPWFGTLRDLPPEFNVTGLWWREVDEEMANFAANNKLEWPQS